MPTYEYECTKGHTFEVVQRITEEPLKRCKICRSRVQRLISASNFILKGSGWYSDGYSSSGSDGGGESGSKAATTSSDSSSSSSKSEGKSDGKSASSGSSSD